MKRPQAASRAANSPEFAALVIHRWAEFDRWTQSQPLPFTAARPDTEQGGGVYSPTPTPCPLPREAHS